jgi:NAD(P)-dependent dehydrogenase (short-subunit alcohol dehydrogenase family)
MTVNEAVVLVTAADGGLGREFVEQAVERGARKVCASARSAQHGPTRASCRSSWT